MPGVSKKDWGPAEFAHREYDAYPLSWAVIAAIGASTVKVESGLYKIVSSSLGVKRRTETGYDRLSLKLSEQYRQLPNGRSSDIVRLANDCVTSIVQPSLEIVSKDGIEVIERPELYMGRSEDGPIVELVDPLSVLPDFDEQCAKQAEYIGWLELAKKTLISQGQKFI